MTSVWVIAANRGGLVRSFERLLADHLVLVNRAAKTIFALALLFPFVFDLTSEEFHGDESHWLTSSQLAFELFASREFNSDVWQEQFYLYSQPQVGKLAIGTSLAVGGIYGATDVIEYDWLLDPEANRERGAIPATHALWFARLPGAVAGWVGALVLWLLIAEMGHGEVGMLAGALLGSDPIWLANSRRAGMDAIAISFGLIATFAALRLVRSHRPLWWFAFGGALGLTVATKYTGLFAAAGAVLPLFVVLIRQNPPWGFARVMVQALGALCIAIAVVVGLNPSLYRNPVHGLTRSVQFFQDQATAMRSSFPVFQSRLLTALEIVDRVIWPIGIPVIIDTTLEREPDDHMRHLSPGQYGTPVIGTGIALAIIAVGVATHTRRRTALWSLGHFGVVWFALCFGALAVSLPIWWERWHLGLVPATCVVAAVGLAAVSRAVMVASGVAQVVASLTIGSSYLNHGFWDLLSTPVGAGFHATMAGAIIGSALIAAKLPERLRGTPGLAKFFARYLEKGVGVVWRRKEVSWHG